MKKRKTLQNKPLLFALMLATPLFAAEPIKKLSAPIALPQAVQQNITSGVQTQPIATPANTGQVISSPAQPTPAQSISAQSNSLLPANKLPPLAPVGGLPPPANNMAGSSPIGQNTVLKPIVNGAEPLDFATLNKQKCRNMPCILDINGMPPSQVVFVSNKPGLGAKQYTVNGWLATGNAADTSSPKATLYFADSLKIVDLVVKKSSAYQWVVEVPTGIQSPLSGKGVLNIFPAPGNQLVADEQSKFESTQLAVQDVANINNIARYLESTINDSKAADLKPGSDITIKSSLIKVEPNTQIKVLLIFKESNLKYELKNIYVADGYIKTKIPESFSGALAEKVTVEVQLGSGAAIPKLVNSNATFTPKIGKVDSRWFSYEFITSKCLVNCFDNKGNRSNNPTVAFETQGSTTILNLFAKREFDTNKGKPSDIGNLEDGVSWQARANFPLNPQFQVTRFEAIPSIFLDCPLGGGNAYESNDRYVYGKFSYNTSTTPYIWLGARTQVTHCRQREGTVLDYKYKHQLYSQFAYVIEMQGPVGANPWIVPKGTKIPSLENPINQ